MGRETALVGGEWAERNLSTPGVVFVETGNEVTEVPEGPCARHRVDRLGRSHARRDRHKKFDGLLSAKGIGTDDTVVLYSSTSNLLAALAYWYFTLYGQPGKSCRSRGHPRNACAGSLTTWQSSTVCCVRRTRRSATPTHCG